MDARHDSIKIEELHPVYQMLSQVIGLDAAVKLGQEFGGQNIYFPQLCALTVSGRKERDRKIAEEYETGQYSKGALGRKYKMTAIGVSDAIKRAKAEKTSSDEEHKAEHNEAARAEQSSPITATQQ